MVREGKRSITVDEHTFTELVRRKGEDETWDEFFMQAAGLIDPQPDTDETDSSVSVETTKLLFRGKRGDEEVYSTDSGYFTVSKEEQEYRQTRQVLHNLGFQTKATRRHQNPEEWELMRLKENGSDEWLEELQEDIHRFRKHE